MLELLAVSLGPLLVVRLLGLRRAWIGGVPLEFWMVLFGAFLAYSGLARGVALKQLSLSLPWSFVFGALALSFGAAWLERCAFGPWPAWAFMPGYLKAEALLVDAAAVSTSPEVMQFARRFLSHDVERVFIVSVGRRTWWRTLKVEELLVAPEAGHGIPLTHVMKAIRDSRSPESPCVRITRYDPHLRCYRVAFRGRSKVELHNPKPRSR